MQTAIWHVTSFYQFTPIDEAKLTGVAAEIRLHLEGSGMVGLVILAPEGINATVAGNLNAVKAFRACLAKWIPVENVRFKDSSCKRKPFRKVSVLIKSEIVTLKRPDVVPDSAENGYLSPQEWQEMLESEQPHLLIDTRNQYEIGVGKFQGAVDPELSSFGDWLDYAESLEADRELPVMLYCTGGIRCEKAAMVLKTRGFQKVFQLRDGILGYLAEFPNAKFEGECFVFDQRVAVDQNLEASHRFGLCSACGDPTTVAAVCEVCGRDHFACPECKVEACCKACVDRIRSRTRSFHVS